MVAPSVGTLIKQFILPPGGSFRDIVELAFGLIMTGAETYTISFN